MAIISTLAAIGMAVGPPLIYVDQAISIIKKKDSSGFSQDVCGVIIIANIIRIFFWLGEHFEIPLLLQSILLIVSQLLLLAICLHYSRASPEQSYFSLPRQPTEPPSANPAHTEDYEYSGPSSSQPPNVPVRRGLKSVMQEGFKSTIQGLKEGRRPFDFWQWAGYGSYLEFLAGLIVVLGIAQVGLGRWPWYIDALGFIALTIESTLPIPQFIANYRNKSCYGFRASTLAGWFFGDAFKTVYFFMRGSPIQFKVTAIMLVCWDSAVFAQRIIYGANPPANQTGVEFDAHDENDDESRALHDDREER
ncbi:hypothetical protein C343_02904 [Cryptococcus neoformans C23]|uniref:PQ-loop repeat-containing protein 1 n=1 Tax=Cryptococcus neoformans (strain H99 / ATCC 208821 / CBS 10515 / FGSC 9487) TaxID=235443 RepID=J9VKP6_CRYN9|nr:hypothetical protein CNAG_01324 [Cryptococcus neoformans var. grubii H99]AUB24535.1 hypothetical protein CKF44_01324 [Cryptococcus neoformans var. grubii]OWZ32272.1 hypothetical protein C347_02967 [Cryptococcus neoformans var. grubii AD2-60a]OWZ44119.1 hypothetical protein C343_02904 [Cryptococcus neoformans var. grubii C23]OXG83608.1 hypothetical protein C349_02833 [Cryptococcus neoformans var. grubii Br795]OXM79287.1 hypothetical protein C364_02782 [Cryptococcus neoformans var. grubii Bt6|eukprot:XP_012048976.1 hypothetical protein CNAG_01324 [Cryptococcus neoformans var. grubii H99]